MTVTPFRAKKPPPASNIVRWWNFAAFAALRAQASAFSSREVLEGELLFRPSFLCDRYLVHLRLSALCDNLVSGVYRSRRPRLEAAACRTHRAVGGNDDAA